jgi:hypothetical protein
MNGMRKAVSAVAAAACIAALTPATAATSYDGEWDVGVVVDRGECKTGYLLPIRVQNGKVSYNGEISTSAKGSITASGAVNVSFTHDQDEVTATGQLRGNAGGGKWTSKTLHCEGRWKADKRG